MENGKWNAGGRRYALHHLPFSIFLLPSILLLTGCQLVGVVAYKVSGPPTIQPQYTPPPTPLLVLAENYQHPSECRYEAEQLAWEIGHQLEEHQVAPIVSPDKLRQLRTRTGGAIRQLTLSDIGLETGAQQVLYVNIRQCQWESLPGTRMVRGEMEVLVKLVEVATGQTVWPDLVSDGKPMSLKIPYTEQSSTGDGMALQEQMCRQLGQQIARLFYAHKADE
jgi:hypothetical protein